MLTIFVPLILVYTYVARRLYQSLTNPGGNPVLIKRWLVASILYCNLLPVLFLATFLLWGRPGTVAFTGEVRLVDYLLSYPFWIALVITVQLFLVIVCWDIAKLVFLPLYRKHKTKWLSYQNKFVRYAAFLVAVYSIVVTISNTWTIQVRTETIPLPERAAELDGLRIVQIGDVQGDGRTTRDKLESLVAKVNSLEPELILFAGDLVTSGERYIESTASVLGKLRPRIAAIAAIGDHDIFSNKAKVKESLLKNGMIVLEDSTIDIPVRGETISITGVTYTYRKRPSLDTLEQVSNGRNGKYRILLAHQPANSLVDYASSRSYNLFVAGHTHGGGIAFGIPGLLLIAPASFETRYLSGLYNEDGMYVSVNNGIGFTLAPIRYHAPAEITLLVLKKK
ncbi:MAG TPA: metallophosphoesterase [Bacteroidota bacterium]|nr:metallophosphoesterase [Bacteroidota bacterium]